MISIGHGNFLKIIGQRAMAIKLWLLVITAAPIVLSGCSTRPTDQIGKFSSSVTDVTTVFGSAVDFDTEVDGKIKSMIVATNYASNGSWRFPPPPGQFIAKGADPRTRLVLLKSLSEYAAALAELNDANLSSNVVSAANALTLSLSDFLSAEATARLNASSATSTALAKLQELQKLQAQRLQAEGAIVAEAIRIAVGAFQSSETRRFVIEMHPIVESATELLANDARDLAESTSLKADKFSYATLQRLNALRQDGKLSSSQKYDLYMAAVNENAAIRTRAEIVGTLPSALKKIASAHAALLESNNQQAIADLFSEAQILAAKIKALKEVEEKLRQARKA